MRAKKRFGQNFLQDEAIIAQIVNSLNYNNLKKLIEIGPGHGALSTLLQPKCPQLDLIELDEDLLPKLDKIFAKKDCNNVNIYNIDALDLKITDPCSIIGNLPYNVATQIMCNLMPQTNNIDEMVFMVQKEIADRITAVPNTKDYGRLTITIQYYCNTIQLFDVPATAFLPQPKVTSTVIRLTPHKKLPYSCNDLNKLQLITTAAFNQRRKTISNSLKKYFTKQQLEQNGITPTMRPEQLSIEQFVALSNLI